MLTYQDNFLTNEECDMCMRLHSFHFSEYGKLHRETKVFQTFFFMRDDKFSDNMDYYFVKLISTKISAYINQIDKNAFPHYWEIVEWPVGGYQGEHVDDAKDAYTSIIYLNDDYEGGETFFGPQRSCPIKPKKGRIVTFNGGNIIHGVNPVSKSHRFTIPVWYGKMQY